MCLEGLLGSEGCTFGSKGKKAQGMLMRHVGDASKLRVTTMDRENHEASVNCCKAQTKPNKSRNPNPTKGGKLGRAIAPIVRA